MALSPRLELRQGQTLVMTPQLQQAIKLLQLSNIELTAYVETELERNPLLEPDGGGEEQQGEPGANGADREPPVNGDASEDRSGEDGQADSTAPTEDYATLDTDYDNIYPEDGPADSVPDPINAMTDSGWSSMQTGPGGGSGDPFNLEAVIAEDLTLTEHLSEQLTLANSDPVQRLIGRHLIDMVDEAGYLRGDLADLAERLGAPLDLVTGVLEILQGLEPCGVFARDLPECLAIQLKEKDRFDPAMQALIENLDRLAKRDIAGLKRICGVDDDDLAEMIDEIRHLNPKPGLVFGHVVVQPVVPDVFVKERPDGGWHVELNTETLPRVLVNRTYYTTVSKTARKEEDKTYLSECLATANWLVKSLDQRARTILKVSREIVRQQDAFLVFGVTHLRPLNLKTVADAIDMHESTVSRVTSNKYMGTGRGIFELKYFFTSAIASSEGGEAHSAEAVRHRMREMINGESTDAILSDDRIVTLLRQSGIDIARRTVAKYREAMRIPSSVQRRREKRTVL